MHYEIEKIRSRFPALSIKDEGVSRIYLDNPGGTQVVDTVVESISKCLIESNANIGGSFVTSRDAHQVLNDAHQAMADFLNSSPDEIIFGQNMTTLTFHLSRSIGRLLKAGDEILYLAWIMMQILVHGCCWLRTYNLKLGGFLLIWILMNLI